MRDFAGHFEVHVTARPDGPAGADRFAEWCRARGLKCVRIVLDRGSTTDQPMATWRRANTTLPAVLAEANQHASDAVRDGFAVVRVKIETDPANADVPATDADAIPELYFEHHVKLRRPPHATRAGLLAVCERHAAHLSRNAFREVGDTEERFVTQRAYGVGRTTAAERVAALLMHLHDTGETVVESEFEYCVYDSNPSLDAGWLPESVPKVPTAPTNRRSPVSNPSTPIRVMTEILRGLSDTVSSQDPVFPVVRGSLLLQVWYGDRARPAGDLDFEVFARLSDRGNRFTSAVDHARGLCCYAVENLIYPHAGNPEPSPIMFTGDWGDAEAEADENGARPLWAYGTPGERFLLPWEWSDHDPSSGTLQIDIAESAAYPQGSFEIENERFTGARGEPFQHPAYSREAMLAAKVSWLARGVKPTGDGRVAWSGEPKDLFDAHLLATDDTVRPDVFRRAMLAIGAADGIDWNAFDTLFSLARTADDATFANWPAFAKRHPNLVERGPAALLAELAERLEPLLGELYPAAEMPFLTAITARPDDELGYLVYADWLDERADPRGPHLRAIAAVLFTDDGKPTPDQLSAARSISNKAPLAWLYQLFGTAERLRQFEARVGGL
jgi:uncharacterized protein (TIGR02996 family)